MNNEFKYIMSICQHPDSESDLEIGKLADQIMNSVPSMRIISARYFNKNNYKEVIKQAIKDENLDETVLNGLIELAIETIERINQF